MCIHIINLFLFTSVDICFSNLKLLYVICPIFQGTREHNIDIEGFEEDNNICYSKHNMQYILMFCIHQKHIYHSCYDYYIHFNLQIHIGLMSHYDLCKMILYTMDINDVTCTLHIAIPFMVYVYLFVIYHMCINIFISRDRTSEDNREREYFTDISR